MGNSREGHSSAVPGEFGTPPATPLVLPAPWPHSAAGFLPACQGARSSSSLTYSPVFSFMFLPNLKLLFCNSNSLQISQAILPLSHSTRNHEFLALGLNHSPQYSLLQANSSTVSCPLIVTAILEMLSAVYQKYRQPVKMFEGQKTVQPPSSAPGSLQSKASSVQCSQTHSLLRQTHG